MDASLQPDTPESVAEVTATQVNNNTSFHQVSSVQSESSDFKFYLGVLEKNFLKIVSVMLIIHGFMSLYDEILEIFFIFPHLPEVFMDVGYSQTAYQTVYQRTILISATAAIESIYGLAVLAKLKHLAHRLHLFSAISLLVISIVVSNETTSIESLDMHHRLPHIPNTSSLIHPPENISRLDLFTGLFEKTENTKLDE